ncbi:MAG: WecB/TagA/CpsF family glycosyltransferase [Clostridiales bacterium]|nr:WecB/TagA/CpsF family glycosyltransferase [Clostridiales bacterium]
MRVNVLGVSFDPVSPGEAVLRGREMLSSGKGCYVVTPNPEIVFAARKDEKYAEVISKADLVLADGIGVVYASKILGGTPLQRNPGFEFAESMLLYAAGNALPVYLLGGKAGVAEAAAENLKKKYPGLVICGTRDGYFLPGEPVAEDIARSGAALVFVCLGFPKQEFWMAENRYKTGAALHIGLGGTLDIFAGNLRRAPESWQKRGLEWLYRLLKEPRRIKRQWKLPFFLLLAVCARLRGKGRRDA